MSTFTLTQEQQTAVDKAVEFVGIPRAARSDFFTIGGLAGTGKTTLLKAVHTLLREKGLNVRVVAPTGKAAQVLGRKGVSATSVHRLIYEMESLVPLKFQRVDKIAADVLIVDESSMVNNEMLKDLLFFRKPIIFVGDYGQLPPIGGDPGIMRECDVILKQIHRQAEGSDIIALANFARNFPDVPVRQQIITLNGSTTVKLAPAGSLRAKEMLTSYDQIIVGKNVTRKYINQLLRKSQSGPAIGDKVICLKNNYQFGVTNGEQFLIADIIAPCSENEYTPTIKLLDVEGNHVTLPYWREYFFDDNLGIKDLPRDIVWLDFAYAITCHKAQGSEWDNILVINEAFGDEKQRWLYTAITRAAKTLTWL